MIGDIPTLTTSQMRDVDRLMMETYQIQLIQMMENAGRHLATLAVNRFLGGEPHEKHVVIAAGSGGNGGGGLVAGRWLASWGAQVEVYLSRQPEDMADVSAHQLTILQKLDRVNIVIPGQKKSISPADVILDAVIGYSLLGAPRGEAARLIEGMNRHPAPVLSLDVPSGMDAGSGECFPPYVTARATLTLALPKTGFERQDARQVVGELYLGDIGVPPELYQRLDIAVGQLFTAGEIRRLF